MDLIAIDPGLVAAGAVIGFLVGLTGMGGGALTTPLLILVVGVPPVLAVGTDLVYAAGTKFVGAVTHVRQRTADLRFAGWMALGAVPTALVGVWTVKALGEGADLWVRRLLGGVLVLVAISVIARHFMETPERLSPHRPAVTVGIGLVVGFLVGTTSVGSGTLVMAVLLLAYRVLPSDRLVGTDLAHGFVLTAVAGAAHWGAGNVDVPLLASLLVGSLPGVWMGSKLSARTPDRVLRPLLAVILLVAGAQMV